MKDQERVSVSESNRTSALALRTRLLIAFTTSTFVTLALAMWYIDRAVERGLIRQHEDIFGDHLAALQLSIDNNEGDLHATEMLLQHTIGGDKNEKSFGCLTNAARQPLIQTPGFNEFAPPLSDFPPPTAAGQKGIKLTVVDDVDMTPLFLASALIRRPGSTEPLTYYFVADGLPTTRFLAGLRLQLGLVLLLTTLLSAGLAWVISYQGLRPIRQITAEIEQTTAKALQQQDAAADSPPQTAKWPSEIARLSGAFAALRNRLSLSFHQLQQFSDDAAHEIRTPLNNMMGLTSLTLQRDRSPEEYRAALASNLEECERLRKLAEGLLFISRADHHRSLLKPGEFDAAQAISEVVDYHSEMARDQNVAINVSAKGLLTADRTLFRQALTNLLSNALRHTPSGGQIIVTFDAAGEPSGMATLTVSDTGEGIAPEHLPHIFDRFYRVDDARTHQRDAQAQTGLGLAIVKAIVDLHGGSVAAESKPGQGTTMMLTWPQ
jgi:two-component system heavy metal sensor histidine kinase CusS